MGGRVTATAIGIRSAQERDLPALRDMMRELSAFERKTCAIGVEDLRHWLFDAGSLFAALVAEIEIGGERKLVGYAAHYRLLYMDDLRPTLVLKGLYVDPTHRSKGIARLLMRSFAAAALELGCGRAHWFALVDNQKAASFYEGVGASPDEDWTRWRMDEARLRRLAESGEG
jgi:GNAT superfamily N-acetyltransferase